MRQREGDRTEERGKGGGEEERGGRGSGKEGMGSPQALVRHTFDFSRDVVRREDAP